MLCHAYKPVFKSYRIQIDNVRTVIVFEGGERGEHVFAVTVGVLQVDLEVPKFAVTFRRAGPRRAPGARRWIAWGSEIQINNPSNLLARL